MFSGASKFNQDISAWDTRFVYTMTGMFEIASDFQVGEVLKNYVSVGCGCSYALGSMYSTEKSSKDPKSRIVIALEAAQEFSAGVREPFIIKQKGI